MAKTCKTCNKRCYGEFCVNHKPRKPIAQRGKRTVEYEKWRNNVAKPYLKERYGDRCMLCGASGQLDVDHIKKRGSHPHLKMSLSNVRLLCRECHQKVT